MENTPQVEDYNILYGSQADVQEDEGPSALADVSAISFGDTNSRADESESDDSAENSWWSYNPLAFIWPVQSFDSAQSSKLSDRD